MINKLWTDVSLENYNNWYPLTGKITETPPQYINTWPNVKDWFTTFAIRAQNDINAYLDFILSKFSFDSFKDELIKETLRDMVYVMVEHWVFNRTPIEFNVDATIQFNNGSQFSASSIPTINVWDLAPSRMKIWARLTELKQVFLSYSQDDEIDVKKIDLKTFYTRNQVDELIKEQKKFTLSKQMKLYDDLVDDNENEIYRGPITNFINKGYVATEYDKETETMILDWPDEIGTLPPEALQNNPQIGDYTHAPTCDFSAKQQKRITTNENEITKLNSQLTKTNESINDIKNNWFNIETSPLWKKMSSFIPSSGFGKTYLAIWGYIYQPPSTPTDNYIYSNKKTIFNLGGKIQKSTQKKIKLDELIVNNDTTIQLLYNDNDITVVSNDINYQSSSIALYQYIGNGTPTEFIAEENAERDYYTKQETNNLLDKKQNKLIVGENITIDENNKISATAGKTDLSDYYKKEEVDKKLEDKIDKEQFQYAFLANVIGTKNPTLETTNKTIAGAINENKVNIDKKQDKEIWKLIGKSINNREYGDFKLNLNTLYRVIITWEKPPFNHVNAMIKIEFKTGHTIGGSNEGETFFLTQGKIDDEKTILSLKFINKEFKIIMTGGNEEFGNIFSLEELQNTTKIDIIKPFKINSRSLLTNKIDENEWDIELKNNPTPTPNPCPCSKWEEVGTIGKNKWDNWEIKYDFKNNKRYRVYYNWGENDYIEIMKEFIYKLPVNTNEITSFEDGDTHQVLTLGWGNSLTIYAIKGKIKGKLWKLQELRE